MIKIKGFPKHIATKQDFLNLLADETFKDEAIKRLQQIADMDDSKANRATTLIDPDDSEKGYNTEIIDNPMPMWKQKGFKSRQAVADLIAKNGGEI